MTDASSPALQAYCFKCKTKRDMRNPQAIYNKAGAPATRGQCPECETAMYRMGATAAHDGIPKPEKIERPKRKKAKAKRKAKPKKRAKSRAKSIPKRQNVGKLVIVESPAKARSIGGYLGDGYTVMSSVGHVRDLLKSRLSVDVDNEFEPEYRVPNDKRAIVKELKAAAEGADEIYLATDPDREGEAIAWHLIAAAEMPQPNIKRVVFHEITDSAVADAFSHPRQINMDLVNAQQARRILDRLVGYQVSQLLWSKVRGGLSAGRVQSIALRLVVEREKEIEAHTPVEHWTIDADLAKQTNGSEASNFRCRLVKIADANATFNPQRAKAPVLDSEADGAAAYRYIGPKPVCCRFREARHEPKQAGRALHHQHAAAGRLQPPRIKRPPHHAARSAALRGHRHRPGQSRGLDYLHAHRQRTSIQAGGG